MVAITGAVIAAVHAVGTAVAYLQTEILDC